MPYVLNGDPLVYGEDVEIDGFAYSYETLTIMSAGDREALGVTWVEPGPAPHDWRAAAILALEASDRTAVRAVKAGVSYPPEWQAYDEGLRAIVNGAPGPLPQRPEYPA